MKRVVTAINDDGRSYVASTEELDSAATMLIWSYRPEEVASVLAEMPENVPTFKGDGAGRILGWSHAVFAPRSVTAYDGGPGSDEGGFHTTRSVDFVVILQGQITLALDEGTALLQAGDLVVQQATRHAWRNESSAPATMLALVYAPADPTT